MSGLSYAFNSLLASESDICHTQLLGWGTMLQAGRLWVRDPKRLLNYFNLSNPSDRTGPGACSASKRHKCQKKNRFWGVEHRWRVRLTTSQPSVSPKSRHCVILNISQTYRLPRPVKDFGCVAGMNISEFYLFWSLLPLSFQMAPLSMWDFFGLQQLGVPGTFTTTTPYHGAQFDPKQMSPLPSYRYKDRGILFTDTSFWDPTGQMNTILS
jgi:hypothetical protein